MAVRNSQKDAKPSNTKPAVPAGASSPANAAAIQTSAAKAPDSGGSDAEKTSDTGSQNEQGDSGDETGKGEGDAAPPADLGMDGRPVGGGSQSLERTTDQALAPAVPPAASQPPQVSRVATAAAVPPLAKPQPRAPDVLAKLLPADMTADELGVAFKLCGDPNAEKREVGDRLNRAEKEYAALLQNADRAVAAIREEARDKFPIWQSRLSRREAISAEVVRRAADEASTVAREAKATADAARAQSIREQQDEIAKSIRGDQS